MDKAVSNYSGSILMLGSQASGESIHQTKASGAHQRGLFRLVRTTSVGGGLSSAGCLSHPQGWWRAFPRHRDAKTATHATLKTKNLCDSGNLDERPVSETARQCAIDRLWVVSGHLGRSINKGSWRQLVRLGLFDGRSWPWPATKMLRCEMANLCHVADPGRLNYGSDWPSTRANACEGLLRDLEATPLLGELDQRAAMRG